MEIYVDAVWALNFCLDFMLLLLTKALARDDTKTRRVILGAFIASLIVPITLFYPNSFITSLIGKIIYSLLIIFCSFGFITIYRFSKLVLLFYFTTFAIGGGLVGLHFLFSNPISMSSSGFITYNNGYGDPVSWLFVFIGFPCVWYFTKKRMDKHASEKIRYDQLYSVSIKMKDKSFSTMGYIDSGNQLVDPLSKKPVIICDQIFLKKWFTEEEWLSLKNAYETFDMEKIPKDWESSIQVLPYQGVQGNNMFLFALRPEHLIVYYGEQQIKTRKLLIGIQFAELTKDNSYHCLLHPQIIQLATINTA
ncbi:sigma-E processing peptidase SpoIIGA [Oceanobacillus caeni]|uniref:Sporulation sigma-E factor-processing peptidase n=1 Tax=Oceanobacillus caeni TaxID=405946 RepID=A0ABR5MLY6_9BACI|nr:MULTISPECIES: sigma-E processing peptidase SpoIIGA [Bacillaceae]KKE78055.1 stage II sporulation protein GA [Bacilli bacterium VT-13-104]PZD85711.1 sigma-E processing peptidase SpoIIGA [Bacilli bacterium]KPH77176.1 stage II sporulation protein GA [Oceanobacillus caeni]MBU8790173.1 sigma-E processing peptidase SpoIIGA [Oceanobacillus caeni]MCR1835617.1 sigma-E processing peptidase SpoIIGA [Oceanobacillus caeni]